MEEATLSNSGRKRTGKNDPEDETRLGDRRTSKTLAEQLHITPRELRQRKAILDFTEVDCEHLRTIKPIIAGSVEQLVDTFYNEQTAHREIASLIGDSATLSRLKKYMVNYILTMFDGQYDEEYILSRLRVGLVHNRIGVSPKYYIAAMRRLFGLLRQTLLVEMRSQGCSSCNNSIGALEKVLYFDLTLVFDMYIHSLVDEVTRSREELEEYSRALEEEVAQRTQQLEEMARTDGLTGLINQRTFRTELGRELHRSVRKESGLTLAYLDLDGFKAVNDSAGHDGGNRILCHLADSLQESMRQIDISSRIGGDEFSVIMPETGIGGAEVACQRLIELFSDKLGGVPVTLSIGLVYFDRSSHQDIDTLIQQADAAMYMAKKETGHAIHVFAAEL